MHLTINLHLSTDLFIAQGFKRSGKTIASIVADNTDANERKLHRSQFEGLTRFDQTSLKQPQMPSLLSLSKSHQEQQRDSFCHSCLQKRACPGYEQLCHHVRRSREAALNSNELATT